MNHLLWVRSTPHDTEMHDTEICLRHEMAKSQGKDADVKYGITMDIEMGPL